MNIKDLRNEVVIVIDFSYVLYRSYYSLKNLGVLNKVGVIRPTGHVVGVLSTVMKLSDWNPDAKIILCLDGYPEERRSLCESVGIEYKAGRSKPDYPIKTDIGIICDLLSNIPNVYIAENEDAESDDVMYAISRHLDKSNTCYIYTSDNDLLQAINDTTFIIRGWEEKAPIIVNEERYMTEEKYTKKFYSIPPSKLPYFRALTGDSSDNIKGIERIPRVLARAIAMQIHTANDFALATQKFIGCIGSKTHIKYLDAIKDDYKRIMVNYQIMNLDDNIGYDIFKETKNVDAIVESLHLNFYKEWMEGK